MTSLDLPSARSLGISSAHRRAIMRESTFGVLRSCAQDSMRDRDAVRAVETIGPVRLEVVGGESAAADLRDSYARTADRFHARAVDYLTRRARGESARDVVAHLYG